MSIDAAAVAAILAEVSASVIEPKFGKLATGEVRQKSGPNDLVTAVDEAAEAALKAALRAVRPDAEFIGEESAAKDPEIAAGLAGSGAFWVVDPLDGTRNFVNGVSEFGSIVALVENGVTQAGWIYAIPTRSCAWAVAGGGCFVDGRAIRTQKQDEPGLRGLRSIGWLNETWRYRIKGNLSKHFTSAPSHCSAYVYLKLIAGEVDFNVSSRIHPWDHLAGALMLSELGGRSAFLDDGSAYAPRPSVDRPLLASAPGRDWRSIADRLTG